jgi:hypothetical protein
LFSASRFSTAAQRYAFAQDIYLIPLGDSVFFKPIIAAIRHAVRGYAPNEDVPLPNNSLSELRQRIRLNLKSGAYPDSSLERDYEGIADIDAFLHECHALNYVLLAVLGGTFPILLAPSPNIRHGDIGNDFQVRIRWDQTSWYLQDQRGLTLFSFDLPLELFELYAEEGELSEQRALAMKAEFMSFFQAIETRDQQARVITFRLDHDWLERLRRRQDYRN